MSLVHELLSTSSLHVRMLLQPETSARWKMVHPHMVAKPSKGAGIRFKSGYLPGPPHLHRHAYGRNSEMCAKFPAHCALKATHSLQPIRQVSFATRSPVVRERE